MLRKSGETYCTFEVATFGYVDYADNCARGVGGAGFAFIRATVGVFGCVEVAEVLELIVFLHVIVDWNALPVGSFEFAVFRALLCDLDFSICL